MGDWFQDNSANVKISRCSRPYITWCAIAYNLHKFSSIFYIISKLLIMSMQCKYLEMVCMVDHSEKNNKEKYIHVQNRYMNMCVCVCCVYFF